MQYSNRESSASYTLESWFKFAQKFWIKDLPHPYQNVKQFEALMSVPLGKDWNTLQSHKRLI
jgi:U3 small nucleolar RNA-associated protein 14